MVRRKLRGSKVLRREYRRRSDTRRRILRRFFAPFSPIVYVAFAVVPLLRLHEGLGDDASGVALNLAAFMWTGVALIRSELFAVRLRGGWYLEMLLRYPVGDRTIFRHMLIRFLMGTALPAAFYIAGSMYLINWQHGELDWNGAAWAVLAGIVQTLASLALGFALADRFPRGRVGLVGVLLFSVSFGFAFGCEWVAPFLLGMKHWLLWATPAGWAILMMHESQWLWLLPLALLALVGLWNVQRLQTAYQAPELESLLPPAEVAENFEAVSPSELAKLTGMITAKEFLRDIDWEKQPWIEQFVARWLSVRERLLTEFLLGGRAPQWTKHWQGALKLALVGMALTFVPGSLGVWLVIGSFGMAALRATSSLLDEWQGLQATYRHGPGIPIYALLPCGFWEITRTLTKVNLIRGLTWLPSLVVCGAVAAWRLGFTPMEGASFGARLSAIELLGQPIAITLLFSSRTNDTRTLRQRWGWMQGLLLVVALLSVTTALITLFAPATVAWVAALAFGLCAVGCLGLYARWYHRGAFDLMTAVPTGNVL